MKNTIRNLVGGLFAATLTVSAFAADSLVTFDDKFDTARLKTDGKVETAVENGALKITFAEGKGYPGVHIKAPDSGWDYAKFSGLQAELTNSGEGSVKVAFRVDNAGNWQDAPYNTESLTLKPGETKQLKVTFGKSYGGGDGYALDPAKIVNVVIFTDNPDAAKTVLLKSITPFGAK